MTKWERRDGVDRDKFGNAALNVCRVARVQEGVRDARFYWAGIDTVAIVVNAEVGMWGPNSGRPPIPEVSKANFGMSDVAHQLSGETWGDAGLGEQFYRLSR